MEYCVFGKGYPTHEEKGLLVEEHLLKHLSPLGWEHINLTGDYVWRQDKSLEKGEFRLLRDHQNP